MGRHTVGDKRGSVRGMPGQNYLPFGSFHDKPEPWRLAIKLATHYLVIAAGMVVLYFFAAILWAIGILPDDLAD